MLGGKLHTVWDYERCLVRRDVGVSPGSGGFLGGDGGNVTSRRAFGRILGPARGSGRRLYRHARQATTGGRGPATEATSLLKGRRVPGVSLAPG